MEETLQVVQPVSDVSLDPLLGTNYLQDTLETGA